MKTFGKYIFLIALGLATSVPPVSSRTDSDIVSRIVKIQGPNNAPGTGFVLGPDKRRRCVLITAKHTMFDHVLDDTPKFKIFFSNGIEKPISPKLFKFSVKDPRLDLALAQVACDGKELNVPLGKSSSISITTPVKVFGYPKYKHSNDDYSGQVT